MEAIARLGVADRGDADACTPLLDAAVTELGRTRNEDAADIYSLLEKALLMDPRLQAGAIALLAAAQEGHAQACELLLGPTSARKGFTPLMGAAVQGHIEVCRALLEKWKARICNCGDRIHGARNGRTPGPCCGLQAAFEYGADVNATDEQGLTALMVGAEAGHAEVCRVLLEKGAEVNAATEDGLTPLIMAGKSVEICKLLLEKGAEVNPAADKGVTPLIRAATLGNVEICRLLLENGADLEAKLEGVYTPVALAAKAGKIDAFEFLESRGADTTLQRAIIQAYRDRLRKVQDELDEWRRIPLHLRELIVKFSRAGIQQHRRLNIGSLFLMEHILWNISLSAPFLLCSHGTRSVLQFLELSHSILRCAKHIQCYLFQGIRCLRFFQDLPDK